MSKEQCFLFPELRSFWLRERESTLRILYSKQRKIRPIVAKSDEKRFLLESRISNNFSVYVSPVGLLRAFENKIYYISLKNILLREIFLAL